MWYSGAAAGSSGNAPCILMSLNVSPGYPILMFLNCSGAVAESSGNETSNIDGTRQVSPEYVNRYRSLQCETGSSTARDRSIAVYVTDCVTDYTRL